MLCCVMENMEKADEMVSRCVFAKKRRVSLSRYNIVDSNKVSLTSC